MAPSLRSYDRRLIRYDVLAGLAAGTVVIPQAMAYATIADLPVQVGLYTCMLPMLAYALLGGSHSLSLSTTSTIAVLSGSTIAGLPGDRSADEALRAAFTLTLLVGCFLLLMRLFRLGALVEQISPATMTGVKIGVGLTVAASQLPTLLGVASDPDDEGFFGRIADLVPQLGDLDLTTTVVSIAAVAALLVLRRWLPALPGPLIVATVGIALVAFTDVEDRGLAVIGSVPAGLPTPTMPLWGEVAALVPGAVAIALMAFMETVLVARGQRQRDEQPVDSDRELLANGIAAIAGGLSQSMPPAGGFSQSAVNQRAGARSQLAGVTTAALAVAVALLLGPVLEDLPEAVLASMVLVAVVGLVSVPDLMELFRIDRPCFWVAVATAVLGLTVGLLESVLIGVILTLVLVLRETSRSQVRPLLRTVDGWRPAPEAEPATAGLSADGQLILHLDQSLYTGNARATQDAVLQAALSCDPRPRVVVLECVEVQRMTLPFLDTVRELEADLTADGIRLVLAALGPEVEAVARRSAWFRAFADDGGVAPSVADAVERSAG